MPHTSTYEMLCVVYIYIRLSGNAENKHLAYVLRRVPASKHCMNFIIITPVTHATNVHEPQIFTETGDYACDARMVGIVYQSGKIDEMTFKK